MSWDLYERNDESEGIFDVSGDLLPPMKFTNGKTQEDIVADIKEAVDSGYKIIFVHGVCGSGKSAMALNLAKHYKKTSIVVPIKSLQDQYETDYTKKMFIKKPDGKPLDIAVIKGRNNFKCRYDAGERADNPELPCVIEIREKNTTALLDYIQKNPEVKAEDFSNVADIKRMNVAAACPYWSPIMPADMNPKGLGEYEKIKYHAVAGKEYAIFKRKRGCPFYDQHEAYATADVLIFNATKYMIECDLGRKPLTDIEIIDECDDFLDSFANERRLHLNRLLQGVTKLSPADHDKKQAVSKLVRLLNDIIFEDKHDTECTKVGDTVFLEILELILANPNLAEDEEFNYYNTGVEVARGFEPILADTYVAIDRISPDKEQSALFSSSSGSEEDNVYATVVSINLAEKFKELLDKNKVFVMMSGTLHSAEVLRDIFGLENFKIIEAETQMPGEIKKMKLGAERNCSFANFKNGSITRKLYLKIFDMCVARAQKPLLVHVNAFGDLPTEAENKEFMLDNLITQETIRSQQQNAQAIIDDFTRGGRDILFTTKCSRGVDFAGDKCRSIIMSRFPYPNISGLFWKILKREQPDKFMEFYLDKANRELTQKIARGVRFKGDWVELLSPDIRVLNAKL
ncbi:MAG: Rad3-related DNA helicase [Patescibacteria group bacterium]|jgi:Rad3-related DNA helicase